MLCNNVKKEADIEAANDKLIKIKSLQKWMNPLNLQDANSKEKVEDAQDHPIELKEIKNDQNLLVSLIGNMETNAQLQELKKLAYEKKNPLAKDKGIINDFSDWTFRTRNYKQIENDIEKIYQNFNLAQNGLKQLKSDESISLKQFGIIYDLAKLKPLICRFYESGLIKGNENLEKLYLAVQHANCMVGYFEYQFDVSFKFPPCSVVFDNTWKRAEVHNELSSAFERLYTWIVNFLNTCSHVSLGYFFHIENKISHIFPRAQVNKFDFRNFLYSDIYQIKLENLIDEKNKRLLEEVFGNEWRHILEEEYEAIHLQVNDAVENEHENLCVPDGKQGIFRIVKIAFAFLFGYQNWFSKDHNNEDIRDKMLRKGKWEGEKSGDKLLCSEFIGLTIITIIQELNDEFKKKLEEKGVQSVPKTLIRNPISEKENLQYLSPTRLLKAMKERHAIEKVTPVLPDIAPYFFNTKQLQSISTQDKKTEEDSPLGEDLYTGEVMAH